jgi:hypothetical protein
MPPVLFFLGFTIILFFKVFIFCRKIKSYLEEEHTFQPYPSHARFFPISPSNSLDLLNCPTSSPVSLAIFSSNGSPSSSTTSAPIPEFVVFLIPCSEPEAGRYHGVVEQLRWQRHHAVNKVSLDKVLSYLAFSRSIGRHRAVCQSFSSTTTLSINPSIWETITK